MGISPLNKPLGSKFSPLVLIVAFVCLFACMHTMMAYIEIILNFNFSANLSFLRQDLFLRKFSYVYDILCHD